MKPENSEAGCGVHESITGHRPLFILCQSILQRPPDGDTQKSGLRGVPRAWWYRAAVRS
jgi:hypothetical protein